MNKHTIKRWLLGAVAGLAAVTVLFWLQSKYRYITPYEIQAWVDSFGGGAPIVFLIIAAIRPLIAFPITIYYLASGLLFGVLWGGVLAIIGSLISTAVAYTVTYKIGIDRLPESWKGKIEAVKKKLDNHSFRNLLFVRLIPFLSFDIVSYTAGAAKLRLSDFMVATFLGLTPRIFAYCYVGDSITDIDAKQFWISLGVLTILSLIPMMIYGKFKTRR